MAQNIERAEQAADEKKKSPTEQIEIDLITDKLFLAGDPLPIDPDTGKIDRKKLTEEQRKKLDEYNAETAQLLEKALQGLDEKSKDISEKIKTALYPFWLQSLKESMQAFRDIVSPAYNLAQEIINSEKLLEEELKKDCYDGRTFADYLEYTPGELYEIEQDESSDLHRALKEIRKRKAAQQAGRDKRRQIKEAAAEQGAIMELRGGTLTVFSQKELWNAFAPGRISKIGTLNPDLIDQNTGRIKKRNFDDGEIIELPAADISYKSYVLLSAIMANSVDNYRETFVKDGSIKFYVKGVLDSIEVDARTKTDGQLNMDRKTAGVLFLEKQFEPMLTQIGTTIDGSRYSVLNYEGYDANSDTMTIRTPYLFTLWRTTQKEYETARKRKKQLEEAGKKPTKKDLAPIKVNSLFKKSAAKEDDAVFEIATFITNKMLQAGKSEAGKVKKTEIKYETLISKCPRLKEKLKAIDEKEDITEKGTKRNKSALYNTELRKIAKAFNLIMNPTKCDATAKYDFISISPARENKKSGKLEFVPPTKSMLDGKIVIKWRSKD